ncbi:MAG: hypothetical protein Ct9H300mP21_06320 [Pseudomonadota bacterium]|nr:MAG: hypothetical protein Ct9H300mP21_06320 [Pseudomonadota bacterium]
MKLGILDTVPRSYWSTDLGITESEKFINFLTPVMPDATLDQLFVPKMNGRTHYTLMMLTSLQEPLQCQ